MTDANDQHVPPSEPAPAVPQPPQPQQSQPQQQPVDQRQWIPVAPPNPYAAPRSGAGGNGEGRTFAIVTMALGLVAVLTAAVSAFYFSFFVLLGALLGLAAVVLGIIALVRRSRPAAAAITGLVAGALAVVVAVAAGALALDAYLAPDGEASGGGDGGDGGWEPDQQQEILLEWPANMETGGVVFEQGSGSEPSVRASDPVPAGNAPEVSSVDREGDVADILLYFDYRCPHCIDFEAANGGLLADLVNSGEATLEVVPLSFVDRQHSPVMAGAFACVADGQPEAAWAAHTALLGPDVQVNDPGVDVLLSVLDSATGGLDPAVRDCVETERFVPFIQALNTWVSSNPVPNALDDSLRVTGTPLALVNGEPYPGAPSDAAAFARFVDEQTR